MSKTKTMPHFHVGQRVVCVDASPNRHWKKKVLTAGRIYIIRAVDTGDWQPPGWGLHLEGIQIANPAGGHPWAFHPARFRPVKERPTDISVFTAMLNGKPQPSQDEFVRQAVRAAYADVWKHIEAMTNEMEKRHRP
jgi:hypothetical protein